MQYFYFLSFIIYFCKGKEKKNKTKTCYPKRLQYNQDFFVVYTNCSMGKIVKISRTLCKFNHFSMNAFFKSNRIFLHFRNSCLFFKTKIAFILLPSWTLHFSYNNFPFHLLFSFFFSQKCIRTMMHTEYCVTIKRAGSIKWCSK